MSQTLVLLFGLAMLYLALTSRMRTYIQIIGLQGIILFLLLLGTIGAVDWFALVFLAFETLVFKAIIVPVMLWKIVSRTNASREADANVPQFASIVIGTLVFLLGFGAAAWVSRIDPSIDATAFGVSVATMIIAFFIIITRKKLITHVMGYMLLENAVSLLSVSLAIELPMLVNLGVLLDVFTMLFLFWLFLGKIHSTYEEMSKETLTHLKDIV